MNFLLKYKKNDNKGQHHWTVKLLKSLIKIGHIKSTIIINNLTSMYLDITNKLVDNICGFIWRHYSQGCHTFRNGVERLKRKQNYNINIVNINNLYNNLSAWCKTIVNCNIKQDSYNSFELSPRIALFI